jgi:3-hydroxybutyryl-CoA dehydrogenase
MRVCQTNDSRAEPYLYWMETSVCVCGAGTMGRGIALTAAMHGLAVVLYEMNEAVLVQAKSFIEKDLDQAVKKNRCSMEKKKDTLQKIYFTHSLADARAPILIEAIQENPRSKRDLFLELAPLNDSDTLFLTNTSSLSVTGIAQQTPFPERLAGLHFFNPANRMKLVEIIQTKFNTVAVIERIRAFARQIGKTPVVCRDAPGFIVNRVARPYYLESLRLAAQNIATPETMDRLMESAGFKMGPFHLMDLIGNDINYSVSQSLYEALGTPGRLRPSGVQEELVKKGWLGKKSGRGFFQYDKPDSE